MAREIPSVFGSKFYHEMPLVAYENQSWGNVKWQASNTLTLHPGAHALHYGSTCFEGMKAFYHEDGKVVIFRLEQHIARLRKSAQLLYMPVPEEALLKEMIVEVVRRSAEEIPEFPGSLYLRPTLIGTDPVIGKAATPSESAYLYVLASPVGDYFTQGAQMRVLIETQNARCAPHMGRIKSGGNYASALHWILKAKQEHNAQQVLFCPNGNIQETGASNFMIIHDKRIITPALSDEFLHGVTRNSVLVAAKARGFSVEERAVSVAELSSLIAQGAEAVLTGTAAVISPVSSFIIDGKEIAVQSQQQALALRQLITDIQYGRSEDVHQWLTVVN